MEEETYAVKSGQYWAVRRVRDGSTIGYITWPNVASVMKVGNMFQVMLSDGRTALHNWSGCFLHFVY